MKVDLYHDGVADPKDDHKRVYERLLEVAIPPKPEDERTLTLEDCLENYFNNRIEVKRLLKQSHSAKLERSNTVSSVRSSRSERESSTHVEVAERSAPNTPTTVGPPSPLSPTRQRTQSIIRRRLVDEEEGNSPTTNLGIVSARNSVRKQSLRHEVVIPAWYMSPVSRSYKVANCIY